MRSLKAGAEDNNEGRGARVQGSEDKGQPWQMKAGHHPRWAARLERGDKPRPATFGHSFPSWTGRKWGPCTQGFGFCVPDVLCPGCPRATQGQQSRDVKFRGNMGRLHARVQNQQDTYVYYVPCG